MCAKCLKRQYPEIGTENEVTALQETTTESSETDELKEKDKAATNEWICVIVARSLGNVSHLPCDQSLLQSYMEYAMKIAYYKMLQRTSHLSLP